MAVELLEEEVAVVPLPLEEEEAVEPLPLEEEEAVEPLPLEEEVLVEPLPFEVAAVEQLLPLEEEVDVVVLLGVHEHFFVHHLPLIVDELYQQQHH